MIGAATFLVVSREHRRWLRRREPYLALLFALLVLAPYLCWDYRHGWISLSFHWWRAIDSTAPFSPRQLAEVPFEQLFSASVFLLVPMVGCPFFSTERMPEDQRLPFLFAKTQFLAMGVLFLLRSIVFETHPNTALLLYPTAVLCTATVATRAPSWFAVRRLRLLVGAGALCLAVCGCSIGPLLKVLKNADPSPLGKTLSHKTVLARHRLFGWQEIADRVQADRDRYFGRDSGRLFTHSHELASLTSFHGRGETIINLLPLALRAPVAGSAQEVYVPYEQLVGQSGIYFGQVDGPSAEGLRQAFEVVEEIAPIEITCRDQIIKRYRVCKVERLKHGSINSR